MTCAVTALVGGLILAAVVLGVAAIWLLRSVGRNIDGGLS